MSEAPVTNAANDWTEMELGSAVKAYLEMLLAELSGQPYNKAEINRRLRAGPLAGRTKGSIEFRMQNISAALYELKLPWITGYLPARNVGSSIKEKLIALLRQHGVDTLSSYVPTSDAELLSTRVADLRKNYLGKIPVGRLRPDVTSSSIVTIVRDPAVKAWVLQQANGHCEGCDVSAPFIGQDGLPYLEVHHVVPLSVGGSDRVTNAVALCPNCHRRCHYSHDRDEFKLELYEKIPRLRLEVTASSSSDTDEYIEA